jgi:hypothetical protein
MFLVISDCSILEDDTDRKAGGFMGTLGGLWVDTVREVGGFVA